MITQEELENIRQSIIRLDKGLFKILGTGFSVTERETIAASAVFACLRGYGNKIVPKALDVTVSYHSDSLMTPLSKEDRDILSGILFAPTMEKVLAAGKGKRVLSALTRTAFYAELTPGSRKGRAVFDELIVYYDSRSKWVKKNKHSAILTALMAELLLSGYFKPPDKAITVYDMSASAGIRLSIIRETIQRIYPGTTVICYGQEKDPYALALARASILLHDGDPSRLRPGDCLSEDAFDGMSFDLCVTGFPKNNNWADIEDVILKEYRTTREGRFSTGLPSVSNRQALYLMNGMSKMASDGKMAILQTRGLYDNRLNEKGGLSCYIMDNDWLETIVRFHDRNDSRKDTCIFILNRNKPKEKKGKVQVIHVPAGIDDCRDYVMSAYDDYRDDGKGTAQQNLCKSRIYAVSQLGFYSIVIRAPVMGVDGRPIKRLGKITYDTKRPRTVIVPFSDAYGNIQECFEAAVLPAHPLCQLDKRRSGRAFDLFPDP